MVESRELLELAWELLGDNAAQIRLIGGILSTLAAFLGIVLAAARRSRRTRPAQVLRQDVRPQVRAAAHMIRLQRLVGLPKLAMNDLLRSPTLLRPFPCRSPHGLSGADALRLCTDRTDQLARTQPRSEPTGRPLLIVGEPGCGKTTLVSLLAERLVRKYLRSRTYRAPLLVSLRRATAQNTAGANLSLRNLVQADYFAGDLANLGKYPDALLSRHFVVLADGLDECLHEVDPQAVAGLLSSDVLRNAAVVSCRKAFFERYLQESPDLANIDVIELLRWNVAEARRYLDELAPLVLGPEADVKLTIARRILARPEALDLFTTPLRLNMLIAISALSTDHNQSSHINNTMSLYREYCTRMLSREVARRPGMLSAEERTDVLADLALTSYDDESYYTDVAHLLAPGDIEAAVQKLVHLQPKDIAAATRDITTGTFLVQAGPGLAGVYRFEHKSFQEYYAALRIQAWMLGTAVLANGSPFRMVLSPEISEVLKDLIAEVREPRSRRALIHRLRERLVKTVDNPGWQPRDRIERQQLTYYLGHVSHPDASEVLIAHLNTEQDPWIQRGICVGLAFGGREEFLDRYIAELRSERSRPGPAPRCDVNIGFHLSFFGDQPFDPVRPDVDLGGQQCGKTVERLIYQLGTETDRGSWRLNLFTIVDLWRHRPLSRNSFRTHMAPLADLLRGILARLRSDHRSQHWTEIEEARQMLEDLETLDHDGHR